MKMIVIGYTVIWLAFLPHLQEDMGKRDSLKKVHIPIRNNIVILLSRNDNVKGNGTHQ
jgi:hypothetical protein